MKFHSLLTGGFLSGNSRKYRNAHSWEKAENCQAETLATQFQNAVLPLIHHEKRFTNRMDLKMLAFRNFVWTENIFKMEQLFETVTSRQSRDIPVRVFLKREKTGDC